LIAAGVEMITKIRISLAVGLFSLLTGCGALPHTASIRTEVVSTLIFVNGPANATVIIDGREAGNISGEKTIIPVSDGTHEVTVRAATSVIYQKTIFIVDGTRRIIQLSK
jgi:hypothetical protein